MKYTLLQMTQNILSALNSDQVNSIGDTTESQQVAEIIQTTYYNMLGRYDLPEHNQLIQLVPSNNNTQPTLMTRPIGTTRIEWIKYFNTNPYDGNSFQDQFGSYSHDLNVDLKNNAGGWSTTSATSNTIGLGTFTFTVPSGQFISAGDTAYAYVTGTPSITMSGTVTSYSGSTLVLNITSSSGSGTYTSWLINETSTSVFGPGYQDVRMIPINDFLIMTNSFDPSENDVGQFELTVQNNSTGNLDNFTFFYKNDKQPQYCTVFQNLYVIFDSYDNTQDSTLQASKTMVMGWVMPQFQMVDTFIPDLDDQQYPLFLNEAKSLAFFELKQQTHEKAEQEVNRQVVSLQKWKAISGKPSYFDELPDFGRRGGYWFGTNGGRFGHSFG